MKNQPNNFSLTSRMVRDPQLSFGIYDVIINVRRPEHYPIDLGIMKPVINLHHGINILGR